MNSSRSSTSRFTGKHWRTSRTFIGNVEEGGLHVLWEAYYRRLRDVWPRDVQEAFDAGMLDRNPFIDGAG